MNEGQMNIEDKKTLLKTIRESSDKRYMDMIKYFTSAYNLKVNITDDELRNIFVQKVINYAMVVNDLKRSIPPVVPQHIFKTDDFIENIDNKFEIVKETGDDLLLFIETLELIPEFVAISRDNLKKLQKMIFDWEGE